jgi:predicted CoA-binding protein
LSDPPDEIGEILRTARTVAVVGLSPSPERDSHRVARYLSSAGYQILPVNPRVEMVLGQRAYPALDEVPGPIDLALVFRRPEDIPPIAEAALRKRVGTFWMQLGIAHPEVAMRLRRAGIRVVEDRCAMVEHRARWAAHPTEPYQEL